MKIIAPLLLPAFLHLEAPAEEAPQPGELVLTFFEVGLGDAILLELPGKRTVLIDAGIGWRVQAILDYLASRGIERLDGLLLTHPHPDHYGGMKKIVEQVPVGVFYHNGRRSRRSSYARLEKALDERGIARRVLRRGDRLDELTGTGSSLSVIYPDPEAVERGGNHNHATIVLRLVHGGVRALLSGDAERDEEERLLALEGDGLSHHVLKLGHHASPGSGTTAFLQAVKPQVAIAQGTGVINVPLIYPRPTYRIRRVLRKQGTTLLTNRELGTFQLVSDGKQCLVRPLEASHKTRSDKEEERQPAGAGR